MGFTAETDWLPERLATAGGSDGWSTFTRSGATAMVTVAAGLDGVTFSYSAADMVVGVIGERPVPCISLRLQREFHAGYDPRRQYLHDVSRLERHHRTTPANTSPR